MPIYIDNTRNNREKQICRVLVYMMLLQRKISKSSTKEIVMFSDQKSHIAVFWNKESNWEQKLYGKMKKWERRHPILGIVLCTILGGILISMIAGVILEAITMAI